MTSSFPRSGTHRRFPRSFYVGVPLVSSLATLAAIELIFSISRPVPFSAERNMYFDPNPVTGYQSRPNSVGHFQNGIVAAANVHGHRDREVSLTKEDGVFRILVLGDSFTVGRNVRQEDAYPQILEDLLNDRSSRRVEVVNTGVGGWSPFQYAQYYVHVGRGFDPDLVLVGFFVGNDTFDQTTSVEEIPLTARMGRRITKEAASSRFIGLKIFLYESSNLARLILNKDPVPFDFTRKHCEDFSRRYVTIQRRRVQNHLQRDGQQHLLARNGLHQISKIREAAGEDGVPLLVVLIPDEMQVNPAARRVVLGKRSAERFDFGMPQSLLVDLFRDGGIDSLDLLPAFLDDPRCLYMNDTHWTPEGHEFAASILADTILAREFERGAEPFVRVPTDASASDAGPR